MQVLERINIDIRLQSLDNMKYITGYQPVWDKFHSRQGDRYLAML